jgi:hypothetical protein
LAAALAALAAAAAVTVTAVVVVVTMMNRSSSCGFELGDMNADQRRFGAETRLFTPLFILK